MPDKKTVTELYEQMLEYQRETMKQDVNEPRSSALLGAAFVVAAILKKSEDEHE
jgi:hypothetical protein